MFQTRSARPPTPRDLEAELEKERELRHKKDAFLQAAYHHINDPLAAVLGFSELLRDRTRDLSAGVRNEIIEMLAIQAKETAQVVDDLLVGARFDLGQLDIELSDVDLRGMVEEATDDWASRQRARLTVSGAGLARADRRWVTQILRNLLRNAAAFGGGNIWVRIGAGYNRVTLDVVDDGPGVAPEDVDRIFEPYQSLHRDRRSHPSLGLGLFVARRLARAMGGDVRYAREEGKTVFELSLPKVSLQSTDFEMVEEVVIDPMAGKPTREVLARIITEGGPNMVYQPLVDMRAHRVGDERILGYEALARFSFASPPLWFEVAGSLGMRLDLELAAIEAGVAGFVPADPRGFLALNLSDVTLCSTRLLDGIAGLDPGRVVLELSEVAVIKSYETTRRHIDALRDRGIRLAVDDVGAGEIDIWHILRLEPAVIKVDASLVRDIEHTPRTRAMIRGISAMAQDLGIMVVAEGIETKDEEEQLLHLGVEYGQGYLFGRPRPLQWKSRVLEDG